MNCYSCHNELSTNDYCKCTKCGKIICPHCADKTAFVCEECGGAIGYLS